MTAPRHSTVTRTTSFPFALFRRLRFGDGCSCPHCGGERIHRWGGFAGRRRYRCLGCRRTFSDFTGTPLAYLKRIDLWPAFLHAFIQCWSVRRTARAMGVARNTAFRWRHRLLNTLRRTDRGRLGTPLVVGATTFRYSEKGGARQARAVHREEVRILSSEPVAEVDGSEEASVRAPVVATRTGMVWAGRIRPGEQVWAVCASDSGGPLVAVVGDLRRPGAGDVERLLEGRVTREMVVLTNRGPFGAAARLARRRGFTHERVPACDPRIRMLAVRIADVRRWLRPFRGVATKYLPNYLCWHRLLRRGPAIPAQELDRALLMGAFP